MSTVGRLSSRQSIRIKDYDYSSRGYYYLTICTQGRKLLFGVIDDTKMVLNDCGKMVKNVWESMPDRFPVKLDEFQIMANHIHFVIQIVDEENDVGIHIGPDAIRRGDPGGRPFRITGHKTESGGHKTESGGHKARPYDKKITLGDVVGAFKSLTTNEYIKGVKNKRWKPFNKRIWQRNYYEHVVRNEKSLNKIRRYIVENPKMWVEDKNNPKNIRVFSHNISPKFV